MAEASAPARSLFWSHPPRSLGLLWVSPGPEVLKTLSGGDPGAGECAVLQLQPALDGHQGRCVCLTLIVAQLGQHGTILQMGKRKQSVVNHLRGICPYGCLLRVCSGPGALWPPQGTPTQREA